MGGSGGLLCVGSAELGWSLLLLVGYPRLEMVSIFVASLVGTGDMARCLLLCSISLPKPPG